MIVKGKITEKWTELICSFPKGSDQSESAVELNWTEHEYMNENTNGTTNFTRKSFQIDMENNMIIFLALGIKSICSDYF